MVKGKNPKCRDFFAPCAEKYAPVLDGLDRRHGEMQVVFHGLLCYYNSISAHVWETIDRHGGHDERFCQKKH